MRACTESGISPSAQVAIQLDRRPASSSTRGARAHDLRPRRPHRHVVLAVDLVAVARHAYAHLRGRCSPRARPAGRCRSSCPRRPACAVRARIGQRQRADAVELHLELAGLAGEVLHVQGHAAAVARAPARAARWLRPAPARARWFRCPCCRSVLPEYTSAETRSVPLKSGTGELHAGQALGIELHRAAEQVDGLHARGRTPRLRQRQRRHVATEADLRGAAFEALDHAAVDVVGVHAEPTLGEEMLAPHPAPGSG